ncbi:DNA topoisomerase IB [Ferruginibacter sp.]|uniref:DNA topoisomerase IB n=1 Tax=Ferruginibacter sp. TaxID=1940288 RepID=UPI001997B7AB|nr:DNA topoisomerase IB [Ferruginibacter sp.]MBC7626422.1 DNA topoisomerase IB [Ferruginibacter sp.]
MEAIADEILQLPKRKLRAIIDDPEKSAQAVNLIYVNDTVPGIKRIKKGRKFDYIAGETIRITDKKELIRIKRLVIPPAWDNVWICDLANGHLQATGLDVKKRKQYRYHTLWNSIRNYTKYFRLYQFGKVVPAIRLQLEKDLSLSGLPVEKVLALVVSLMERTNIRIGNSMYEKLYGSFGLTTLKDKHVNINGSELKFSFKGKKGVHHDISIKNKKLSILVKSCRDIPGKELFQYYTSDGDRRSVDSGMVNEYIKKISGGDFTAKDFRTWSGTIRAFLAFKELGLFETATEAKRKVAEALDMVSKQLGNTRNVCKKYYVHPVIVSLYENRSLGKYLNQLDEIQVNDNKADLTAEEKIVMKILESH